MKGIYLTLKRKKIPWIQTDFAELWETQRLSSMWNSEDLFRHSPCGFAVGWQPLRRPRRNCKQICRSGWGQRTARCNTIPVSPLRYIAAESVCWSSVLGGTKGSCARISPNCQSNLEVLVGTLASWLCLASGARGLVLQSGFPKSSGRDTAWQISMDRDARPIKVTIKGYLI